MKISVKSNFLQLQARRADVNERSFFIIIICFNHLDLTDLPNCAALCNWAYFPSSIMEKHSDICRPLFISFTSSCGLCVSFSLFISIHEARKLLGVPPPFYPAVCGSLFFGSATPPSEREWGFFLIKGCRGSSAS